MAMNDNIFPVVSQPGIQRDGTTFDSDSYIDGQWCRFYRGKPQKIGGYIEMFGSPTNVPRGVFIVPQAQNSNIYVGDASSLKYRTVDNINGNPVGAAVDRTPLLFVTSQSNQWLFDIMYDTTYNQSTIVAMANQNLLSIDQPIERPIYYGPANTIDPLIETGFSTSGGFVSLHPYLLIYGNDGDVRITNANDPTTLLRDPARVTGSKIVAGLPCRAGQNSPACLLWSLDSLIRVTSVGTADVEFSYDTISAECSILSSNSAIEYNGNFYWVGIDTFYFYNGVIQEWPNSMSLEYFFDNLNFAQRQKVWISKVTRYGEIWIFYPHGNATECNRALIYCVREKSWYDTGISRSCGDYNTIFNKPVWADNALDLIDNDYPIWRHEVGVDQVSNGVHTAINSYFEMSVISYTAVGPGGQNLATNKSLYAYSFEPDFAPNFIETGISTGDMTLIVNGREYPNSIINNGNEPVGYTFNNDTASINFEEKIDVREKRRLMTLRFDSNTIGGNYKMGKCLLVPKMGDSRP
jgi:hypothetical protein